LTIITNITNYYHTTGDKNTHTIKYCKLNYTKQYSIPKVHKSNSTVSLWPHPFPWKLDKLVTKEKY